MANSVNNVILLGRLGQDPELRTTPQGASVCTLNLATNENYKDSNGEWVETTDWHRVTLWENLAERAGRMLKKGNRVYIEGKLKTRSYDKDGEKRYITDVRAMKMVIIDGEKEDRTDTLADNQSNNYQSTSAADDDVPF